MGERPYGGTPGDGSNHPQYGPSVPRYDSPFAPNADNRAIGSEDTQPTPWARPDQAPPEATQVLPPAGPSYHDPRGGDSSHPLPSWPPPMPPSGPPIPQRSPHLDARYAPRPPQRSALGGAAVVAIAALTASVIGTAAGFGGAKLADLTNGSAGGTTPASSRAPLPPAPAQANIVEVAKRVVPSTVMIKAGGGTGAATGSGFVLDTQGRIMTNNHVVESAADGGRVEVAFSDGRRAAATIVGRSPSYDLAVIKVAASPALVPMQIGDSGAVRVGETVIAVGAPLGLPGTVTSGIISSRNRPVMVGGGGNADAPSAYINAIQTDAPINPGNSGGPLIDGGARVVGVNSAILTLGQARGQNGNIGLGFAIPINQAMEIGRLLIKDGKATYPIIGATVRESDDSRGVVLSDVDEDGPAAAAGLRSGDKITSIDKVPVTGTEQLIVTIRTHRPKDVVVLGYERDGSTDTAEVILGSKEG